MKELSLLMFFVACGYAINHITNHFSNNDIRKSNFFIPSYTIFNIFWGFIFYIGFATLMSSTYWIKILLFCLILIVLGMIIYYHQLKKNILTPKSKFFLHILANKLQLQQKNDSLLNRPYTRKEALKLLGIPLGSDEQAPIINQRLLKLSELQSKAPGLPYLEELISLLEVALSPK